MKLIVSSFVCAAFLASCERQPPSRPTSPRTAAAPTAPPPATPAPTANLDGGGAPPAPVRLPQTPEALAAYARIDAGVPSVDAGPRPITGRPTR